MRFVVVGAGSVGGVLGARLHLAGHDVVFVARGAQMEAIAAHGLRIDTPSGREVVPTAVMGHSSEVRWRSSDVVLLCVKSQDSGQALADVVVQRCPAVVVERREVAGCWALAAEERVPVVIEVAQAQLGRKLRLRGDDCLC